MQNYKINSGYIYIRTNEYWDLYDVYKLGKSSNILERENNYITSEIKRGKYIMIIELNINIMDDVEKKLQKYFNKLGFHIKFNAGTELYKKDILKIIIPYLIKNKIDHKILSDNDIEKLIRKNRISTKENTIEPYKLQQLIINNAYNYFQKNNKGLLILPCGVGKTLISLWITKKLNLQTIIIGVPNILLLNQWEKAILLLFNKVPYMIVASGVNKDDIIKFINENINSCIIITTYASSYKVVLVTKKTKFTFDMKINDEVHHLTATNIELEQTTKTNIEMLKILHHKQISLTATMKQLDSDNVNVISNDNKKYFGKIIDRKCLLWAIENNMICDYVIQTIITDENELEQQLSKFNIIEENDKRLFLSAFASLKSIFDGHSHHLLIYSNNKDNSLKLIQYIKILIDNNYFDIPDLYYSNYHSEMKSKDQKEIINNFEKSKFGIITCVYCLGEGYDNHNIDAVVFAENMTSNIRIVQSALRASRKNNNDINKKTKIILPILNRDDWLENNENSDLKKVREVIYQMGLEDETITQKIKVFKINIEKQKPKISNTETKEMVNEFGKYDDKLTQKLRLKTIKRTELATTYEKARKIIADKNIKSKESYYELCDKDNRLSKEPDIIFQGKFTNWIEYLSIERIYYDLETCKNKINEYLLLYPEIKIGTDIYIICNKLCILDNLFPPNKLWIDYYNVKNLQDIIILKNKKKKIVY